MKIKILSRKNAIEFIKNNPDHPIIAIGESKSDGVLELVNIANNCLCLRFDDIEMKRLGYVIAEKEHIQKALDWAKDKEELVVACAAGISRSSAITYLILCEIYEPKEAIQMLDEKVHMPNWHIVQLGSKMAMKAEIYDVFAEWMGNNVWKQ